MNQDKTPMTPEEQIEHLKNQVKDLKQKLEQKSPVFADNLNRKAKTEYNRLCEAMGEAIHKAVGRDLVHLFKSRKFVLGYDSDYSGTGRGWVVYIQEKNDTDKIIEGLEQIEMRKFQESLDNFAWAVKNGGGGG